MRRAKILLRLRHTFRQMNVWRRSRLLFLALLTTLICLLLSGPVPAQLPLAQTAPQVLEQQSKTFYETGRYPEAIANLQQAIQQYQQQGDRLRQAIALSNLALIHQHTGDWAAAERESSTSLEMLQALPGNAENRSALAQSLDVRASLELNRGQAESAVTRWEQAVQIYLALGDTTRATQSQLNRAHAMQSLGLYRRAIVTLTELVGTLQSAPASVEKVSALRSLGDALRVAGNLDQSQRSLQQSLSLAQQLNNSAEIAATQLSLGNLERTRQNLAGAIAAYQQAAQATAPASTRLQAQLNHLSLLLDTQQTAAARALLPAIQAQMDTLPPGQPAIYARINLAESLLKLSEPPTRAVSMLAIALQQAKDLGDRRAESFALGSLGAVYESNRQWPEAQDLTQQALLRAQTLNASDIAYRWQWQLGRLLKAQGKQQEAIATYSQAFSTLQTIRSDLVAMNPDVQFSFRESVEPVYRQLVDLLLTPEQGKPVAQKNLTQARTVLESLQLAELENFFREACLDARVELDQIVDRARPATAVVYPIVLSDRLEVIIKLPGQPNLLHYATAIAQSEVERTIDVLRRDLLRSFTLREVQSQSQKLYDWMLKPAREALTANRVETLVFVLDGSLRNIPMATLYDGQQYLLQQYSIALAPGLQLVDPKPLERRQLRALLAGLSEARDGFTPLKFVNDEVNQIAAALPGEALLNQQFTERAFQQRLETAPFSIVHIATHGQFSSDPNQTFILAWDNRINVNELNRLLRTRGEDRPEAVELLVLSACQTATGDRRAALGLAGVAVRAGARSTLASLWNLDDETTAFVMNQFYRQLLTGDVTKSEALRRAQLALLNQSSYRHPRYWAPYVLLGNWL